MKTTTIEALDQLIEVAAAVNQWDELPNLLFVADEASGRKGMLVTLPPGDVAGMLHSLAANTSVAEELRPISAIVLQVEGWALRGKDFAKLQAEHAELQKQGKGIADHPDGKEIKTFTAIDSEGTIDKTWWRGEKFPETAPAAGGRVPEALAALFEALR